MEEAYRRKGYEIVADDSLRFGIKTVNELTCCSFLNQIRQYKITTNELKNMLMNEVNYDEKLAYNPSLYIDFDNKILISHYAEPESFEDFVPDGWEGKYQDFESIIPQNQRYWTDVNGKSLITGV